ncbi:MAG: hypothetical protein KGL95_15240 [Patescibacteria group bacterium]|nr:hypothetical protein [Patescibacteria group bacterium]
MKHPHLSLIAISSMIVFSSSGIANATIAPPIMTLQTDKGNYQNGETMKISGIVADDLANENSSIFLRIFAPDGLLYDSATVQLEKVVNPTWNGYTYGFEYSYNLKINGTTAGDYEIIASSYSEKYMTKWALKVVTYEGGYLNPDDWHTFQMPTIGSNKTHLISYKVSDNVQLQTIAYNDYEKQMYIDVRTPPNGGDFIIQIPRYVVDSRYDNGTDRSFGVDMGTAAIGPSNEFIEIGNNSTYRTLEIFLPVGVFGENIVIGGFESIPEFPFAIPVLLISITSLIIFYRMKFRK